MKTGFYLKLALSGMRKNKRMYVPYLLSGAVMTVMTYILFFLAESDVLNHIKGGGMLQSLLPIGSMVVGLFSCIFLFYSNSFLMKQRYREFGLYHVLGMDKRNLGRIMLWENAVSAAVTLLCGLFFGIALSKLAELCMVNLLKGTVTYSFHISAVAVAKTVLQFLAIHLLLLCNALIRVRRSSTLALLQSADVGEKPPRANWLLAALGVVLLGVAYYIALSIQSPLSAVFWFMAVAVLVIAATYLLLISGSVALCRILQNNKHYYYRPNHFISVSAMKYRMKQNGAGLASICVLCTMVLVMLSSTVSMYIGAEDALNTNYPQEISLQLNLNGLSNFKTESFAEKRRLLAQRVPGQKNALAYYGVEIAGLLQGDRFLVEQTAHHEPDTSVLKNLCYLNVIPLAEYNELAHSSLTLQQGECFTFGYRTDFSFSSLSVEGCRPLKVRQRVPATELPGFLKRQSVPCLTLVVQDVVDFLQPIQALKNKLGSPVLQPGWFCDFDVGGGATVQNAVYEKLEKEMGDLAEKGADGSYSYSLETRERARIAFYSLYGTLFFIGVLLSAVFVFAAVLIVYYKQISEGYEDQKRFAVLQKVGMTGAEIRRSINSQVLTVFFLPLLLAGAHLAVAFPIIWKLLQVFMFKNLWLMVGVTVGTFLAFAAIYAFVYKITSNSYYHIVSEGDSAAK